MMYLTLIHQLHYRIEQLEDYLAMATAEYSQIIIEAKIDQLRKLVAHMQKVADGEVVPRTPIEW